MARAPRSGGKQRRVAAPDSRNSHPKPNTADAKETPQLRSQEELSAAMAAGQAQMEIVNAPMYYVTSMRLSIDTNDCTLVFQRPHPVMVKAHDKILAGAVQLDPVAIVSMSPQSAKDLYVLLQGQLKAYEAEWGEIETEFTRRRKAGKEAE